MHSSEEAALVLGRARTRARAFFESVALGAAVGAASGIASAVFLLLLERATRLRTSHEVLVYALPLAGLAVGAVYERWGKGIRGGSDLVLDAIHGKAPTLPLRMAPMVLVGTVLTHLFGGSAGREGTAVQMGASLAETIARRFGIGEMARRRLLAAGVAGGFGSVFGTPLAGAVFGLEVACIGRLEYGALVPALVASFVGDSVTRRLGATHTDYPQVAHVALTAPVLGKLCVVGVAMALATVVFIELGHRLKSVLEASIPRLPARMFVGGIAVVVLWRLAGTSAYLGLGVDVIVRAFHDPMLPSFAFAAKLVFTVVTLSAGFLGGEVTPLFFVGATLGSVTSRVLGLPLELGAAVGVAAVFGAAANAPIALTVMAVELVGFPVLPHVMIVVAIAYVLSGHRGIYGAQRLARSKLGRRIVGPLALRDLRAVSGRVPAAVKARSSSSSRRET